MAGPFFNRTGELGTLAWRWATGNAELVVVVGRRRVGKSRLLSTFFAEQPCVRVVGTLERPALQLEDATREVYRVIGDTFLEHQPFSSWDALLAYLANQASHRRLGLVLDEFPYYCAVSPDRPSVIARWWDRVAQQTKLMVVLAGSDVPFMENLVLAGQAMYGRRTAELRVHPFDYGEAGRFVPAYPATDRLRAYGVFGGMPAYLAACRDEQTLGDNIVASILSDDAYLRREPLYLLSQAASVDNPTGYLSILRSMAGGATQLGEIARTAGFRSATDISKMAERLREFRLVERITPVGAEPRGKTAVYVICDPFVAFWFRFVQPAESALERGLAETVYAQRIAPHLDAFISRANGPWEQACRDYLWRVQRAGALGSVQFDQLGSWWEGRGAADSAAIDIVGRTDGRLSLVGSCEWRNRFMKIGDLDELRRLASRFGADAETPTCLFSRSGFDPALVARAAIEGVRLIDPAAMFAEPVVLPD